MDEQPPTQSGNITIHPDVADPAEMPPSIFSKGVLIAVIVVVVGAVVGFSVLIGFDSTSKFQGMINKVKVETEAISSSAE